MNARLPCVVPFCRRTTQFKSDVEWICGKHWPLISLQRRRVWGRLRRRWRRYGPEACSPERWYRIWDCLKREAIERAMGIN